MFVAPDEHLWVATSAPGAEDIVTYDVLDSSGRLVKRVRFPTNVVLLGFGKGVLYATRKDEDDLRYLQRYSIP